MTDYDDRVPLEALDPGTQDPGFWVRFHSQVMGRAQMELARRRMNGDTTVADVLFAWRKALVPTALLAAALAAIFLMSHEKPAAPLGPVAVEEALIQDLEREPIPAFLGREPELEEVAFLASVGGF